MGLSLVDANRVIEGALAKARELGVKVSVAICDTGGRLVAFQRLDGSILASVFASQGKAITSVTVGRPSGDVTDNPTLASVIAAAGGILIAGREACLLCATELWWAPAVSPEPPGIRTKRARDPASNVYEIEEERRPGL